MPSDDAFELDDKKLQDFIKALSGKLPVARVGILGNKNARSDTQTNASIGLGHEFGEAGKPVRSFLRVPISEHLSAYVEKSGAFEEETLKKVIEEKSLTIWIKKIAVIGENIVAEAFATGGFGKWKPSNMKNKSNQQTLVETQQLRNSITSDVK